MTKMNMPNFMDMRTRAMDQIAIIHDKLDEHFYELGEYYLDFTMFLEWK